MRDRSATFASRLAGGEPIIGTFVKTPSPIVAEVLGMTDLDACCLDAEHAPFGRVDTDLCVAMLRAADMPVLIRTRDGSATEILNALDYGATGVQVPHVTSAQQAEAVVRACHFGEGGRGYAGSTRAASYTGKPMPNHLADSAAQTTVVVQIEDLAALENLDDIARVEGVHALFVGRADLAVAMGCGAMDDAVIDAVKRICETAQTHGRAVGMFTPAVSEVAMWRELGASFFLLNSDHGFILQGAKDLVSAFRDQTN